MMYEAIRNEIVARLANWETAVKALRASGVTEEQMDSIYEMLTGPLMNLADAAYNAGTITGDQMDNLADLMSEAFQ